MSNVAGTLDPLRLPLQGERLIETSVGAGRTFVAVALCLRLSLGLGGSVVFPRPLTVEELLVVTSTETATAELCGRIRSNIHELHIVCLRRTTDNLLHARLLEEIDDKAQTAQWLLLAGRQMDETVAFITHGFRQRMLNLNTFGSDMPFEQQLIEDESLLRYQAYADFWCRYCYPLTREIIQVVFETQKGSQASLRDINRYLQGGTPVIKVPPPDDEMLASRHARIVTRIDMVKQQWRDTAGELDALIESSGTNRRKSNRSNQAKWTDKISAWAEEGTGSYRLPESLEEFSQCFLEDRTKAGGETLRHPLFEAIDQLLAEPLSIRDLATTCASAEVRETVAHEKCRRGELGFDNMLGRLDSAPRSENDEISATAIRTRFPVVMIGEFQDADPQQHRIFHRIWYHQSETASLLVGDSEQAICAFRDADISTYMKARSEVRIHYTLDTNRRFVPGMVNNVNKLFSQADDAFMLCEIPFIPVKPAGKNQALYSVFKGEMQPATKMWLMEGESCGIGNYQSTMAQVCAAQTRDWLQAGQRGEALLMNGDDARPVRASDISVPVRSHQEAAQMRDALTLLEIPSAYLSNRGNVFETPEAQEIFWLLQAVMTPKRENTPCSTLATSMIGLNALDIETPNNDEHAWDAVVEELDDYRQIRRKRGAMSVSRALTPARNITESLLAMVGGEQHLTDILHISEPLQETGTQLKSEHTLVR